MRFFSVVRDSELGVFGLSVVIVVRQKNRLICGNLRNLMEFCVNRCDLILFSPEKSNFGDCFCGLKTSKKHEKSEKREKLCFSTCFFLSKND